MTLQKEVERSRVSENMTLQDSFVNKGGSILVSVMCDLKTQTKGY